jgi:hypothetical protein
VCRIKELKKLPKHYKRAVEQLIMITVIIIRTYLFEEGTEVLRRTSQSPSYITTDGQSVSLSWSQARLGLGPGTIISHSLFNYF